MNLRHTHVLSAIFVVGATCAPMLFMRHHMVELKRD